MSKIKLLAIALVFGLASTVYATTPTIQDKHAQHGKASCCSAGAACCDGGACCSADKASESCSVNKDGESCCNPGAACCDGGSCCEKDSNSKHEHSKQNSSKPAKKAQRESAKGGTECCSGGSCCTKNKSRG